MCWARHLLRYSTDKLQNTGISDFTTSDYVELDEWLATREQKTQLIQQQLLRAQQRMKHQADKHRFEHIFAVGDQVYLKLQPYIQSSLAPRSNQNLAFRFFGPYTILKRVGEVAYQLDLPPTAHIHDVVHVSQLKMHIPPKPRYIATYH